MKKYILDFRIIQNTEIAPGYHQLMLSPLDGKLPEMLPGQFVNILVPDSNKTFLRRPISVNFADYQDNVLSLVIKSVGEGTAHLCNLKENDILNLILPLGKSFTFSDATGKRILLIGGGVGAAPLLFLADKLKKEGAVVKVIIGARTVRDLSQLNEFSKYGEIGVTTEDGTMGVKGFVTAHPWLLQEEIDEIKCCGPLPMMKSVARMASKREIPCEVSLENRMACGVGACLCCVENTKEGHKCVCTDGPVFEICDLNWNENA